MKYVSKYRTIQFVNNDKGKISVKLLLNIMVFDKAICDGDEKNTC